MLIFIAFCLLQPEPVQQFPPFYLPVLPNEDKYPGLPPLVCINPFTIYSYDEVNEQFQRHLKHLAYLRSLSPISNQPVASWIKETEDRAIKWELVERLLNPNSTEQVKRNTLSWLKTLMTDDEFYYGKMPIPFGYAEYPK